MVREKLDPPLLGSHQLARPLYDTVGALNGTLGTAVKFTAYEGVDWNLDAQSLDDTVGAIARFRSASTTIMEITKAGASLTGLTVGTLVVTTDASVGNDLAVGRDVAVTRNLAVNGNTTLGNAVTDTVATGGDLSVGRNLGVTGSIINDGLTAFGNADGDTHTYIGNLTVKNLANTLTPLFVDVANGRTIVGSVTALTTAADDRFTVVGGIAYFAGNSGPSIGIRWNASQTVGWTVGVSAAGANADLIFRDDGAVEKFRLGDSSSVYQANLTGNLFVSGASDLAGLVSTGTLHATSKVAVGASGFSGSEEFRVVGDSRFEGAVVVTTGGATITGTVAVTGDVTHTGTWTDWTPTVSQPGALTGTVNRARYRVDGDTVHVQIRWTKDASGSGTSGNAVVVGGFPAAIQAAHTGNEAVAGAFLFNDAGTRAVGACVFTSASAMQFWVNGATSPLGGSIGVASGDILAIDCVYEAA